MRKARLFDHAQAKSVLLSSILVLATILSSVFTGLSQESVGSKLHTETGLPSNQLVATIPLGLNVFPTAIVVSPDSKTIYVASFSTGGSLVSIVDSQTNYHYGYNSCRRHRLFSSHHTGWERSLRGKYGKHYQPRIGLCDFHRHQGRDRDDRNVA